MLAEMMNNPKKIYFQINRYIYFFLQIFGYYSLRRGDRPDVTEQKYFNTAKNISNAHHDN